MTTSLIPCRFQVGAGITDATSMNFYIAGMYPSTTYKMHSKVVVHLDRLRVCHCRHEFSIAQQNWSVCIRS